MRKVRWLLFIVYCGFIIWYTVLSRKPSDKHEVQLSLFWPYRMLLSGAKDGLRVVVQNLQNIAFFIPFGLVIPVKRWWKVAVAALCLSVGVEVVQYIGGYGLAELDDVICNVLGAMIGYWIVFGGKKLLVYRQSHFED